MNDTKKKIVEACAKVAADKIMKAVSGATGRVLQRDSSIEDYLQLLFAEIVAPHLLDAKEMAAWLAHDTSHNLAGAFHNRHVRCHGLDPGEDECVHATTKLIETLRATIEEFKKTEADDD